MRANSVHRYPLALASVAFVLPSVVFNENLPLAIDEVASREPCAAVVVDVGVG